MIRILDQRDSSFFYPQSTFTSVNDEVVRRIIDAVSAEQDEALLHYARELDGLGDLPVRVSEQEIATAAEQVSSNFINAAQMAIRNIREFAEAQMPREFCRDFSPGRKLGWIVRPLDAVGCYVPSGRYPLCSTLLMTAVLAQVAGVPRICITSPKPSPEILACAHLLGIQEFFRVGGAHAIAALALGTPIIRKVNRIVGPGNSYVTAAKRLLSQEAGVGIDFLAGPTEILIIAAEGNPKVIAADMLAQAEHDVEARAMLLTTSIDLAEAVAKEIESQLQTLPTAPIARESIDSQSFIAVFRDLPTAVDHANEIAPEHLSLHHPELLPQIRNAGTVFLGSSTPESAGDYAAGPSHVLPTAAVARLRGGLTPYDFVKMISVQQFSPEALHTLEPTITTLARAEGLEAHARAVEVRCGN
ncbi:MAG TPA: histidinol dehydrogenase [Bryobacteraceae bacterium]|nr:histidinol dehydrogenase [Bryobacteraceae bacterium]